MNRVTNWLLSALVFCLAACSTTSPQVIGIPVRLGMTNSELVSCFGAPVRRERNADGSEDWFYNFGAQSQESRPISEAVLDDNQRSYSVGRATETTTTMTLLPIHLSAEGRVVGSIPAGRIIVE